MAGGTARPLLELEDEDELLLEALEDELLELLDDELLELLELLDDEVPPDSCPPHAPIMAARAAAPRILTNFIMRTLSGLICTYVTRLPDFCGRQRKSDLANWPDHPSSIGANSQCKINGFGVNLGNGYILVAQIAKVSRVTGSDWQLGRS